jgi:hypothetical protein
MSKGLTTARVFDAKCTCGNRLGYFQYKFEKELFEIDMKTDDEIIERQLQLLPKYGWDKMCCRASILFNTGNYLINNSNADAFNNDVNKTTIFIKFEHTNRIDRIDALKETKCLWDLEFVGIPEYILSDPSDIIKKQVPIINPIEKVITIKPRHKYKNEYIELE